MQADPKQPQDQNDQAEQQEDQDAEHVDHRHEDPHLQTPDNLQHGDRFRPEGEK